jgi:hypothetical protein
VNMKVKDVLTNEFHVRYEEAHQRLAIYMLKDGKPASEVPISLRLSMLEEMGPAEAAKFLGERLMLLIPALRERVYKLPKET